MLDVVALGELLIDFAPVSTDAAGYPALQAQPGGAPGNFLAALQAYGCKTALIGKVGADSFGQLLVRTVAEKGIETRGITADPAVFTTLAFVTLDATGNREFSFARKPGADTCLRADEVAYSLIDEAKVFHFGTLSLTNEPARTATQQAVAYAKEKGKLISFDPNLRKPLWASEADAKAQIEWGLRQADIVKISDEEIDFLWGIGPEAGAQRRPKAAGRVRRAAGLCDLGPQRLLCRQRQRQRHGGKPRGHPRHRHDRRGRHFRRQRQEPVPALGQSTRRADGGGTARRHPLRLLRGQPLDPDPRRHHQRAGRSRRARHRLTRAQAADPPRGGSPYRHPKQTAARWERPAGGSFCGGANFPLDRMRRMWYRIAVTVSYC